jgi:hypothetical protein
MRQSDQLSGDGACHGQLLNEQLNHTVYRFLGRQFEVWSSGIDAILLLCGLRMCLKENSNSLLLSDFESCQWATVVLPQFW